MSRKKHLSYILIVFCSLLSFPFLGEAQLSVADDFEGNGTIHSWTGDDCGLDTAKANPFPKGINTSSKVLEYADTGGQFANVRFEVINNFDLSSNHTFSLKIYIPGSGLSGNQKNQVSLKLQDGSQGQPWTNQCEIIKPVVLDQWQVLRFDFKNDTYINANASSLPPTQRLDFNRVVIQVNGEGNNDKVIAYIDDLAYDGTIKGPLVFGKLIWSDEFIGTGAIDTSRWFHQTQLPAGGSWFNGEVQHYTNRTRNAHIDSGFLKITARKENFTDQGVTKDYTSARLNSKFALKYGKVEIRAKLPTGKGTWPALWMLGKNIDEDGAYWDNQGFGTTAWPACGEIDIMEHWGNNQNYVQSAMHTPSSHGNTVNKGGRTVNMASSAFHDYSLEWTPDEMVFRIDGIKHYTYDPTIKDPNTWPFDAEQYLILNIAIEPTIDPAFTMSTMYIDYIRVYEYPVVSAPTLLRDEGLMLYPNPVEEQLRIHLEEWTEGSTHIEIYSANGTLVRTFDSPVSGKEVFIDDLASLSSGNYLIRFELKGELFSFKFLKL